jgi:hypothetical protein
MDLIAGPLFHEIQFHRPRYIFQQETIPPIPGSLRFAHIFPHTLQVISLMEVGL